MSSSICSTNVRCPVSSANRRSGSILAPRWPPRRRRSSWHRARRSWPAADAPRQSPDLDRLQHQDHEAVGPQMPNDASLIAASRLDPDAVDPGFGKCNGEMPPPGMSFSTCQRSVRPWIAISSLSLDVSISAANVLIFAIFVDPCLVKRTRLFRHHPGPMKVLTTITLRSSQKQLRVGSIRSPAALLRMAVRSRAFLSEHADDNRSRCYKGGLSSAPRSCERRASPRVSNIVPRWARRYAPLPTLRIIPRPAPPISAPSRQTRAASHAAAA